MIAAAGRKALGPDPRAPGVSSYNTHLLPAVELFLSFFLFFFFTFFFSLARRVGAALPPRPPALLSCAVSAGGGGERGAGALPAEEAAGRRRGGALRQPPAARRSGSRRGRRAAAAGAGGGRGLVPELPGAAGRAEEAGGPAGCRRLPAQRPAGKCRCSAQRRRGERAGGWSLAPALTGSRVHPQRIWEGSVTAKPEISYPGGFFRSSRIFRHGLLSKSETVRLDGHPLLQPPGTVKNEIGTLGRGGSSFGTRRLCRCRPVRTQSRVPGELPVSVRRTRGSPALMTPPRGCRLGVAAGIWLHP